MAKAIRTRIALDEDVRPLLGRLLWDRDSRCRRGRRSGSDRTLRRGPALLAWATREGPVLVTHNASDYARMAASWARAGRQHAGIMVACQSPIGWLIREVLDAIVARPWSNDWINQIVWAKPLRRR